MNNTILRPLLLCFLIQISFITIGQNSKFGTYYDQRKSLFETLPDKPKEIIFLGNSITDGCEWAELFNNKHIVNRGISGDVTAGVLNRLAEITRSKPAKVFLLIGINDLARGIPEDTVFTNICKIVSIIRLQSPDTKVYIQSILPVNDMYKMFNDHTSKTLQIMEINAELHNWCQQSGYVFIDLFNRFKNSSGNLMNPKYTNDGLHLLGKGYQLWAEIIRAYLK